MEILAINSSAHGAKGATQEILSPFLEGAKIAGAEVKIVFLKELNLKPCLGCYGCWIKTPGFCTQDDDMADLIARVKVSELVVFAGPVYVDGISALGKLFLDRLIPLMDCHLIIKDGHTRHPIREYKFPRFFGIVTCGFYEKDNTDVWVENLKRASRNFSTEYIGTLIRPSSHILFWKKDYGDNINSIKEAAHQAGYELVTKGEVSLKLINKVGEDFLSRDEVVKLSNAAWERQLNKIRHCPKVT